MAGTFRSLRPASEGLGPSWTPPSRAPSIRLQVLLSPWEAPVLGSPACLSLHCPPEVAPGGFSKSDGVAEGRATLLDLFSHRVPGRPSW